MSKLYLPIDTKSLYFNIKNDNKTGHTPTVATPLVQGSSVHTELAAILNVPENINSNSKESFITKILSKSRIPAKINRVFVFDKVSVNGIPLGDLPSFCIYIREETDPNNVHLGRQKVHYPQSVSYSDTETEIDNKTVFEAVSGALNNYAYIVEAFEYDTEQRILNFDATVVGENGIPYSKVFLNKRGVGNKFSNVFNEYADIYDSEIISMREHLGYDAISPDNFMEVIGKNKELATEVVTNALKEKGITKYRLLNQEYPYSLYDIEYSDSGKKKYIIVRFTSTKICYFNLPINHVRFFNDFSNSAVLALVADVNDTPHLYTYTINEVNSMSKAICSITYELRG